MLNMPGCYEMSENRVFSSRRGRMPLGVNIKHCPGFRKGCYNVLLIKNVAAKATIA